MVDLTHEQDVVNCNRICEYLSYLILLKFISYLHILYHILLLAFIKFMQFLNKIHRRRQKGKGKVM